MPAAELPPDESDRHAALLALQLLDTERSPDFDIYTELASRIFSAPIAAISLVDADRQWFKSKVGVDVCETARDISFCAHTLLHPDEALIVQDAREDPRFAQNPLVTGPFGLRFYAGMPIKGPTGHVLGALCVIDREPRNIQSSQVEQLRRLAHGVQGALKLHASQRELGDHAVLDPLTALFNGAGFLTSLRGVLAADPAEHGAALLFLNVDEFRVVNDMFGHGGGDAALREIGNRLVRVVRTQDVVARYGADEFCILVREMRDTAHLNNLAARIHAELGAPFSLEQKSVTLRTSIGIAIFPDHAGTAEDLIRVAEGALLDAKRAGRGCTRIASARRDLTVAGRGELRETLRRALLPPGHEPFALALQPIFSGQTRQLKGFEALVRWPDGPGGSLQPADFIPQAEATGLIVELDRWSLNEACRIAASWPAPLRISSNLSAANFFAGDLVSDVRTALERQGLAPSRLKLEITETVLLGGYDRVGNIIAALRALGVHVVLDDFGAGYASIAYLRDYTFDGIKIDRSFVADLETNWRSRAFVRAIVGMVRALGIEVTAEGVETEAQYEQLRRDGVSAVQGFLLGRPMPEEAALALIRQASGALPMAA